MATRARQSVAANPEGAAFLDSYDAFRRKHVSQNKEIIHKNSELMKTNGDLSSKLREAQQELMIAKGEMIRLKGATFQLDMQNAHLREVLRREQERCKELEASLERAVNGATFPQRRIQLLQQALEGIAENAKQAQSLIEEARSPTQQRCPTIDDQLLSKAIKDILVPLAPADSPSQPSAPKTTAPASRRATLATQPDLSLISEASTEAEASKPSSLRISRPSTPVEHDLRQSTPPAFDAMRAERRASGNLPQPLARASVSPADFARSGSTTPPHSPPPQPLIVRQEPVLEPARPASAPPAAPFMPQKKHVDLGLGQTPHWPAGSAAIGPDGRRASSLTVRKSTAPIEEPAGLSNVTQRPRAGIIGRSASNPVLSSKAPSAKAMKPRPSETGDGKATAPIRQIVKPRTTSAPLSLPRPSMVLPDPSESSTSDEDRTTAANAARLRALKDNTSRKNNVAVEQPAPVRRKAREGSAPVELVAQIGEVKEESEGLAEGRRARKEVNYAQPSLNKKLRRPVDYVPTIARHRKSRHQSRKSHAPSTVGGSEDGEEEEDEAASDSEEYATAATDLYAK